MKKYQEDNPIRRLRKDLGLNQPNFGKLIGRSHQSVQAYETGAAIPDEVVDRLKTIAAERGWAHLALELSSDDWRVRTLIHPPQDFAAAADGPIPVQSRIVPEAADRRWHEMLNQVLHSGNEKAINAVQSNLLVFSDYVGGKTKKIEEHPIRGSREGNRQ